MDFAPSHRLLKTPPLLARCCSISLLVFRLNQLLHSVSAEEAYVGNIFATVRNGHFTAVVGYGNKGDDLVVRTFDIELKLLGKKGYEGQKKEMDSAPALDGKYIV